MRDCTAGPRLLLCGPGARHSPAQTRQLREEATALLGVGWKTFLISFVQQSFYRGLRDASTVLGTGVQERIRQQSPRPCGGYIRLGRSK